MAFPLTIANQAPVSRINRSPAHSFEVRSRPFQIVPFCLAPVLPGETLESMWFEAREVSDPLASNLRGLKSEYHWFYVKLRDLANDAVEGMDYSTIETMFTDPLGDGVNGMTDDPAAPIVEWQHNGGLNWTYRCYISVIQNHFRDRNENWMAGMLGEYALAQVREQGWQDSLTAVSAIPDGSAIGDPSATSTPEELQALMDRFELLQSYGWSEMSFEDYLASNGVHVPKSQLGIPERLYSLSKWTYPSNTVDPSDGSAIGAASFVFKEMKRDKKRFTEPGFIIGLHVVRPKVFFGNRKGQLAHYMTRGLDWLPAVLADNPETSLRTFGQANAYDGPLGSAPTEDYVVDMRDLLVHGDSFVNFAEDAAAPRAALPTTDYFVTKYLSSADVNKFFANDAKNLVRADGFCSFTIRGTQRDFTRGAVLGGL